MKHLLLTLLFAVFSFVLKAGENTSQTSEKRLYGGFVFTPGVSHAYLKLNYVPASEDEATMKRVLNEFKKIEHPDFGFEIGGVFGARLLRFLTIETGVKYMMHRYTSKSPRLTFASDYNAQFQDTNTIDRRFTTTYNSHYINIPVGLNFEIGKGKVKGIISPGLNVNLLATRTSTGRYFENGKVIRKKTGKDNYPSNYSIYNFSPYLSAGIDYSIYDWMSLRITATGQMQTLKNTDTPFVRYMYFAGINMGLLFHFDPVKKKSKGS